MALFVLNSQSSLCFHLTSKEFYFTATLCNSFSWPFHLLIALDASSFLRLDEIKSKLFKKIVLKNTRLALLYIFLKNWLIESHESNSKVLEQFDTHIKWPVYIKHKSGFRDFSWLIKKKSTN